MRQTSAAGTPPGTPWHELNAEGRQPPPLGQCPPAVHAAALQDWAAHFRSFTHRSRPGARRPRSPAAVGGSAGIHGERGRQQADC